MTTPQQLYATLEPIQQLNGTLQQTGPAGPPGPPGPPGADGLPHIIQDEGVALATFDTLNFAGAGVTASVDTPGARITVTIPGGSQTPWTSDINAATFDLNNVGKIGIGQASVGGYSIVATGPIAAPNVKGSWFGGAYGHAADSVPSAFTTASANLIHYGSGENWAGEGTDSNGNYWLRVGLSNAVAVRFAFGSMGAMFSTNVAVTGDCNVTGSYRVNGVAQGQTPWTGNVDAAGFELQNASFVIATIGVSTPFVYTPHVVMTPPNATAGVTSRIQGHLDVLYIINSPGPTAGASLEFRTGVAGGSEAACLRLADTGNAGLPTPHATYKLNVTGDCNITGEYRINGVVQGQTPWVSDIEGAGFYLSNVGNLAIGGAVGTYKLAVIGGRTVLAAADELYALGVRYNSTTPQFWIGANATGDYIVSQGSGTKCMEILLSGNAGFPTSHATYKLNVTGDCNVSGEYRKNGTVLKTRAGHTWALVGDVTAITTLPSIFVPIVSPQTATLVSLRADIASGTSIGVQVKRNGSNVGSVVTVTTTAATTSLGNVALSDGDELTLVLSAPTGTPSNLGATLILEHTP